MDKVKNIFKSMDNSWLIRHYLFSFAFLIVLTINGKDSQSFFPIGFLFFLLSSLLYPFAMFVYESLINLIVGDNLFILPLIPMLIWKFVRFVFIFILAIPIGVIGFIYLYLKLNK